MLLEWPLQRSPAIEQRNTPSVNRRRYFWQSCDEKEDETVELRSLEAEEIVELRLLEADEIVELRLPEAKCE